jgi:hypothetical protein
MSAAGAGRYLLAAAAATACALFVTFVASASVRRLNFDEALALRAGSLEIQGVSAEPPFVMPTTLLLGAASKVVADPGALFLGLRLLVTLLVAGSFWAMLRAAELALPRRIVAITFLLSQSAYATHGFEFRYDAGILIGLQLAVAGTISGSTVGFVGAGAALAFAALHQTKGALLALLLAPFVVAIAAKRRGGLRAFVGAFAGTVSVWLITASALGLSARWLATIRTFATVGGESTRVPIATTLGPAALRDLAWWLISIAALAALARSLRQRRADPVDRLALAATLATLGVAVLHPHAWVYMLALPAPFVSLVVARSLPGFTEPKRLRTWFLLGAGAVLLQLVAGGRTPLGTYVAELRAPRAPEVRLLRELRRVASVNDEVLDPSGLVYFLRPCTRQWYLDTLFAERVAQGRWMIELASGVPANCRWVIRSYRLSWLPPAAKQDLRSRYAETAGAIGRRFDTEPASPATGAPGLPAEIENFW